MRLCVCVCVSVCIQYVEKKVGGMGARVGCVFLKLL